MLSGQSSDGIDFYMKLLDPLDADQNIPERNEK